MPNTARKSSTKKGTSSASKQPAKSNPPKTEPTPDDSAMAALDALTPRLRSLDASAVAQPRIDVRAAASFILSDIVPRVTAAGLYQRLQSLPAAEFDFAAVADLKPAALACLASQAQLSTSAAQAVTVRLPADLLDEGTALKSRMLRVCVHQFADDAQLGPEVAAIRAGTGYLDLAEDLLRLAALYKSEATTVALDGRFYDPKDVARASALSARITSELRPAQGENTARDLAWRAYTFLHERYEEVASAGRFLLRKADGDRHFPTLRAATGQGRRRSRVKAAPVPAPAAEAAEPQASR